MPLLGNVFVPLHKRVPDDIDGVKANESAVLTKDSCGENHAALKAKLQEAERERGELRAWKTATHEQWAAWTRDDFKARAEAAEAREAALREALEAIAAHEPTEVVKDDFAYGRLVESYREAARTALATADPGASK